MITRPRFRNYHVLHFRLKRVQLVSKLRVQTMKGGKMGSEERHANVKKNRLKNDPEQELKSKSNGTERISIRDSFFCGYQRK